MFKMASHESFGHLQPKLWAKEGPGVKLAVWLPTIKNRESTRPRRVQQECDMALESSQRELQPWFKPRPDPSSGGEKLWTPKVSGVQTGTVSRLHLGSPKKKSHLDVASTRSCREYYKGEGGGFPRVRAVVSQVSPSARGLSQHPKWCIMSSNQLVVDFGCRIV
jgi:hypothetical protein